MLAWRVKAPRPQTSHYGEAPFRTFTRHSLPSSPKGSSSKRSPVPERDNFVQIGPFMPVFARSGMLHAFSPCIYQASWSDAALRRRLRAGRTFASPRRLARGFGVESFWLLWSAQWPLWGGPSLSAGLRRKASLRQRAVS